MGVIIAVAAVAWAWSRMGREDAVGGVTGFGAVAFWAVFGVVLAFGSFTSLFVILLPAGAVLLALSKWVEPVRSWLALTGLVGIPTIWLAIGVIDAGTGGWVTALVALATVSLIALAFETRQRRLSSS
jgi:hypothetical protein